MTKAATSCRNAEPAVTGHTARSRRLGPIVRATRPCFETVTENETSGVAKILVPTNHGVWHDGIFSLDRNRSSICCSVALCAFERLSLETLLQLQPVHERSRFTRIVIDLERFMFWLQASAPFTPATDTADVAVHLARDLSLAVEYGRTLAGMDRNKKGPTLIGGGR